MTDHAYNPRGGTLPLKIRGGGGWLDSLGSEILVEFEKDILGFFKSIDLVHVPNFGGLSGSEDRGGGDNSIQFIKFGRVGDKSFKEWRQKIGGGRMGDNNILTFSSYCTG